jgi:hypothetical protein
MPNGGPHSTSGGTSARKAALGKTIMNIGSGDWGDVPPEDIKENELSLQHGFRLLSAYHTSVGDKLWVITEADRSSTCILLPEEY